MREIHAATHRSNRPFLTSNICGKRGDLELDGKYGKFHTANVFINGTTIITYIAAEYLYPIYQHKCTC